MTAFLKTAALLSLRLILFTQTTAPRSYYIMAGDISMYANQTGTLKFSTVSDSPGYGVSLDDIRFSYEPPPEQPPFRMLSAGSVTGHDIGICFNAAVDPASASDPRNYSLADTNIVVTNATVRPDGWSVALQLSQHIVGYSFVLIANDVRSAANAPLTERAIAGGLMPGLGGGFNIASIGISPSKASVFGCTNFFSNSFDVSDAQATGVAGTNDSFVYLYHDGYAFFSTEVQVTLTQYGSGQAGLMARKSLEPGSPMIAILVSQDNSAPGVLKVSTLFRDAEGGTTAPWPGAQTLSFPPSPIWIGLTPTDNGFSAFVKTNQFGTPTTLGSIQATQFTAGENFFLGTATATDTGVLGPSETKYRNYLVFHGDYFFHLRPVIDQNSFSISWPSDYVAEWSGSVGPAAKWNLLTNSIQFGQYTNEGTFEILNPYQKRFFRLRVP